jgi:hypothetical protein
MLTLLVGISGPILDAWFLSRISDAAAAAVGATLPVVVVLQSLRDAFGQAGAARASPRRSILLNEEYLDGMTVDGVTNTRTVRCILNCS